MKVKILRNVGSGVVPDVEPLKEGQVIDLPESIAKILLERPRPLAEVVPEPKPTKESKPAKPE